MESDIYITFAKHKNRRIILFVLVCFFRWATSFIQSKWYTEICKRNFRLLNNDDDDNDDDVNESNSENERKKVFCYLKSTHSNIIKVKLTAKPCQCVGHGKQNSWDVNLIAGRIYMKLEFYILQLFAEWW